MKSPVIRQMLSEAGGQRSKLWRRFEENSCVNFPCERASGTRRTHMKTATVCFSCTLGNKAYGMVLNMSLQRFPWVCCLSTSVRAESPPPKTSFLYLYSPPGGHKRLQKIQVYFLFPSICFLQLMQSDASAADSDAVWKAWVERSFDLGGATINQPVYLCAHAICMRPRVWSTMAAECCWIICRSRCWRGVWLMYNRFWREHIWLWREEEPTSKALFSWRVKKSWGSSMRRPLWACFAMKSLVRKVAFPSIIASVPCMHECFNSLFKRKHKTITRWVIDFHEYIIFPQQK